MVSVCYMVYDEWLWSYVIFGVWLWLFGIVVIVIGFVVFCVVWMYSVFIDKVVGKKVVR